MRQDLALAAWRAATTAFTHGDTLGGEAISAMCENEHSISQFGLEVAIDSALGSIDQWMPTARVR
jgi:hypothetical protein